MGIEGHLYNLEKDGTEHETAFRCCNCHYFEDRDGAHYCGRRERTFKWNPETCYCTEYGAGNGLDEWEARIFPMEVLTYILPAPPTFSEFIEAGAPRITNPVQTNLDQWGAGA